MKKSILFALTVLLVLPALSQAQNSDPGKRLKGVDKELNEILETWKAPGFAVAVVEKNEIIYANDFIINGITLYKIMQYTVIKDKKKKEIY